MSAHRIDDVIAFTTTGLEDFFHYIGGLTTPPCTSGSGGLVRWVVDADTVGMTSKQLEFLQTSIMTRPETEKGEAVTISTFGNSRLVNLKTLHCTDYISPH